MHSKKMVNSLKGLFFLGALFLLLTFNASNTFADFYVIAGSKGVGTKITALPYTIASSGFYFIAKDLSCAAGSHGITVNASNVTLDLMGFSLIGPDSGNSIYNGIHMDGRTNVEIRNGTVRNFAGRGIYESDSNGTGHRIINIRVRDNRTYGLSLSGKSHLVEKCTAVSNIGYGIYTNYGCTVTGNTCYDNTDSGIDASAGCTVTGNTCYDNTNDGINASSGCTVTGNTCYSNNDHGIYAGNGSTVIGNTCRINTDHGIYLAGDNFVDQNTATNNTGPNINDCAACTFGLNHAP